MHRPHHRLAAEPVIPLKLPQEETPLLSPRRLAPAYYDEIVAACQEAGFSPDTAPSTSRP